MTQRKPVEVTSITSAHLSHTDDLAARRRKYVWMMVGRLACLLLACLPGMPNTARVLLLVGMVVLPWGAVQIANGGAVKQTDDPSLLRDDPTSTPALGASTAAQHRVWDPDEGTVLDVDADGRVVREPGAA